MCKRRKYIRKFTVILQFYLIKAYLYVHKNLLLHPRTIRKCEVIDRSPGFTVKFFIF